MALFFCNQNLFWKQNYFNFDAYPVNNIKIFKNVLITINIFKNGHIDIDIDIVHPYIEHPYLRDARATFVWDLLP